MLFDLRGRGRRRTVQIIYAMLAILMGGGLVFFGIGGNTAGGLFDALGLRGGSHGSGGATDVFSRQVVAAQKRLHVNPGDVAAWDQLATARFQQAVASQAPGQQSFTGDGKKKLEQATTAWDRYTALNPPTADDALASKMVQAFAPFGPIDRPASGVKAAQVVTAKRPTAQSYYALAVFAYAAGDKRTGSLAATQTLRLTPPARKTQTKLLLEQAKKPGPAGASAPSPGTSATGQ